MSRPSDLRYLYRLGKLAHSAARAIDQWEPQFKETSVHLIIALVMGVVCFMPQDDRQTCFAFGVEESNAECDDHFLSKDFEPRLTRCVKALDIARRRLSILVSEALLGVSGIKIDGVGFDYIKVRGTPLLIRYRKDGNYESTILSLNAIRESMFRTSISLQGNWKCRSVLFVFRGGTIDRFFPFSYFSEVEEEVMIYKYGLINPIKLFSCQKTGMIMIVRNELPKNDQNHQNLTRIRDVSFFVPISRDACFMIGIRDLDLEFSLWTRFLRK